MAKRTVHHMDLPTLMTVNREIVHLTHEPHECSEADRKQLEALLAEVASRADNQDFAQAIPEKTSLLVYKLASGQHFRAGNKRTALVAGLVFLRKNGFKIKIDDPEFVSVVDKAGMAAASLDDVFGVMGKLTAKSTAERKAWEGAVVDIIVANSKFLTDIGS